MYQPPHFREDDLASQHALIRAHPFGLLISAGADGPVANALPFQLSADASPRGTLRLHMARANGQWRDIAAGAPVLAVFQGTNAYVTPSWYATKRETGKVVPTWNYAIVQARGVATVIHDAAWLHAQVSSLTLDHERRRAEPWQVDDAPETYVAAQMKGIVGVEIEITAIEGKWKVSQNRPAADIAAVASGLADHTDPHANDAMAALVRNRGRTP